MLTNKCINNKLSMHMSETTSLKSLNKQNKQPILNPREFFICLQRRCAQQFHLNHISQQTIAIFSVRNRLLHKFNNAP